MKFFSKETAAAVAREAVRKEVTGAGLCLMGLHQQLTSVMSFLAKMEQSGGNPEGWHTAPKGACCSHTCLFSTRALLSCIWKGYFLRVEAIHALLTAAPQASRIQVKAPILSGDFKWRLCCCLLSPSRCLCGSCEQQSAHLHVFHARLPCVASLPTWNT